MSIEVKGKISDDDRAQILWGLEYYNIYNVVVHVYTARNSCNFSARVWPTRRLKKHSHYRLEINTPHLEASGYHRPSILFHEVTHIKQFEQDGLQDIGGKKNRWKGQIVHINENNDSEYFDAPWEQEARLAESKLWFFYRKHALGQDI